MVFITGEAENDILEIYRYIARQDSRENAEYVLYKIQESCLSLEKYPLRGHIPPELERINISLYKEIHFKPYRIIYQVEGKNVYMHCVVDGRRSLQEFLEQRLLR
jgi:toxin ParE1/3/4